MLAATGFPGRVRSVLSDEQIGKNLARLRGDMSQKELAAAMRERGFRWSQATVWSVEKGERPLRLSEAEEIAAILGTFSSYLAEDDDLAGVSEVLRVVADAHHALSEAIKAYDMARFMLAVRADDAADSISDSYAEAIEDWLDRDVAAIVAEVARQEETEALAERQIAREIISDEREGELREAARAREGRFSRRLRERTDGVDQAEG
jgi:transcriptional regulator with XRE-family HTH domain